MSGNTDLTCPETGFLGLENRWIVSIFAPQKNRIRYKMIKLDTKFGRVLSSILSVVLVSGIFTSCNKGPVDVLYDFDVITENTAPNDVQDPEIQDSYVTLLSELNNELAALMELSGSPFLGGTGNSFKRTEGVELNPKDIPSEDERKIAISENDLFKLKQIESSYKERVEKLEKRDGTSFHIDVHYLLARRRENSNSVVLKEYQFELKYN